ncbi:MAG TPA: TonB-dependent receptor [Burkholderiales bacterium]
MHRFIKRAPIGLALFGISIGSSPSFAQTTEATAEPVIVTATRFPERRLDAPIGTRIITAEEIQNSTANTLPEVLQKLGGVHVSTDAGTPDLMLDLRGFGKTGDDNVAVLLDGVRMQRTEMKPYALSGIPLSMVERIEILPGGGAVQYGAGTAGGTINIITKAPRAGDRSGTLFAGAGRYGTSDLRGSVGLAGDEFGFTFGGSRYESDNYRDNNDVDQQSGLGTLRWQRGDHRAALSLGADHQSLGLPGARTKDQLKTDRSGTDSPTDHSHRDGGFGTFSLGTRWGDVELDADAGYRESESHANFDFGFGFLAFPENSHRTKTFSPRARWTTSIAGMPSSLIGGVDLYEWQLDNRRLDASPFGDTFSSSETEERSRAFYLQLLTQLTDTTRLNAGWRVQRVTTELHDEIADSTASERHTLYANEIGLRQALSDHWSIHGKFSRSFRLANADENASFVGTAELLEPQRAKQRELGVEYRAGGVRASVVGYDMRLENEIATLMFEPFPGFFLPNNTNLSPTRRRGVELSADWQATPTLELGAAIEFIRATFRSGVSGVTPIEDNDVPLVPRRRANAHVAWYATPKTRLSAHYTYVGRQRYDNDQANLYRQMPSYSVVDLRVSHEIGDWLLAANLNNAFDEQYYSYAVVAGDYSTFNAYPQGRRSLFVSAEYRFR